MNLDDAIAAHAEWKVKLRGAISRCEVLDARTISADNCCALGKWLHGPARSSLGQDPAFSELVARHAAFHQEAGRVAAAINAKDYARADAMLGAGTPYATASSGVGIAINRIKKSAAA